MTSASYLVGIDGGGTKCRARLRDAAGRLLGEGVGGAANIRLGLDVVWEHMLNAIGAALAQAGLGREIFPQTALGLGLAGITTGRDAERTVQAGPRFLTVNAASDGHAACLGAFSGQDGAILITGTGSAGYAWVRGEGHAIGGWGFEVSDDGSAAALGREALRAALHGHDGLSPHTPFTRAVVDHFGGHPAEIVAFATQARPADYGALAPIVMQHAEAGDPVAVGLVEHAAVDLGRYIHRLHEIGGTRICLMGGMAGPMTPWLSPWTAAHLSAPEHDAIEGALYLAKGVSNGLGEPEAVL